MKILRLAVHCGLFECIITELACTAQVLVFVTYGQHLDRQPVNINWTVTRKCFSYLHARWTFEELCSCCLSYRSFRPNQCTHVASVHFQQDARAICAPRGGRDGRDMKHDWKTQKCMHNFSRQTWREDKTWRPRPRVWEEYLKYGLKWTGWEKWT
jgi:hypothetical protein